MDDHLIPAMFATSRAFAAERAGAAMARARANHRKYGLAGPRLIGSTHAITEVMFDRQFRGDPIESCSREVVYARVAGLVEAGAPIEMTLPALPFKFSSPLKNRGRRPDLAELNFLLGLYEIALTIELIYRAARPGLPGRLARFTVASDGHRFNRFVNEPDAVIEAYRARLTGWIRRLRLDGYITLVDYRALLREAMPPALQRRKAAIAGRARATYAAALWPVFDPYRFAATMVAAAGVEPDPESANREGRFVSLLRSLVYTIRYEALRTLERLPAARYRSLYRELTGHLFEPYAVLSPAELDAGRAELESGPERAPTVGTREYLRQAMLREAWECAINYLAEIKSDRELADDPIMTCLPHHFRWTIHAKSGQLAVSTPIALGIRVQAWAGTAVFRWARGRRIKLCTLPVLALEGTGATPVRLSGFGGQPFFYIDPDIAFADMAEFLSLVRTSLVRRRTG
ncbi:L-tyrosine/L-tryptophan isonitrile synthase family protein [Actinoplanes sp. NPDC049265]|uniref:L-tyrosine/L-tryptophan isonitrile synthase family protein n=1 Tax=Actinoplanes sp. NPDC049265 TaxID=3363902 RepID=UPI003710A48A